MEIAIKQPFYFNFVKQKIIKGFLLMTAFHFTLKTSHIDHANIPKLRKIPMNTIKTNLYHFYFKFYISKIIRSSYIQ